MSAEVVDIEDRRGRTVHEEPRLEHAVLACIVLDNAALDEVADMLVASDFADRRARLTWSAARRLHANREPIDLLTLRADLEAHDDLRLVGDEFLMGLTEWIPQGESVEHYARRVRSLASVRAVLGAARAITARGSRPIEDATAFVAEAEALISAAAREREESRGPVLLKDAVVETVQRITESAQRVEAGGTPDDAVATRFGDLDRKLGGGFRGGNLVIVAGRPGMGKTAFGLDLAFSLSKAPGIFHSLEMSTDELVRRGLVSEGRVDGGRLRLIQLTKSDWTNLTTAAGRLTGMPIYIDDTPAVTLSHVRSAARRQQSRGGLAWVIVDYLQLMRSDDRSLSPEKQVSEISRGLKQLARELNIPVFALAQLNRDLERRPIAQRRPVLADLRDSGAIEQDADVVLFLYREEEYLREAVELRGMAECIIGKQRAGPTGTVKLRYFAEHTRFESFANDAYGAPPPDANDLPPLDDDFSDEGWAR